MAEKLSISLRKEHIRAVERFGRRAGISSFSGALQAIIHTVDQQQKAAEAEKQTTESAQPAAAQPSAA